MADEKLIASFDVGKRYVRKYKNGRTEISTRKRTENPKSVEVIDEKPTLTKDTEAVKLPPEKWTILEDGSVKVAYEIKPVAVAKEPILVK
jgi:hypothetical protein